MSKTLLERFISDIFKYSYVAMPIIIWKNKNLEKSEINFYKTVVQMQKRFPPINGFINIISTDTAPLDKTSLTFLQKNNFVINLFINLENQKNDPNYLQNIVKIILTLKNHDISVNPILFIDRHLIQHVEKVYSFFKRNKISWIDFSLYLDKIEHECLGEKIVDSEEYAQFLCKIFDMWKESAKQMSALSSVRLFDSLLYQYIYQDPDTCPVQQTYDNSLALDHLGNLYSCDCDLYKYRLGNIMDYNMVLMLNSKKHQDFLAKKSQVLESCKKCHHLQLCRKGFLNARMLGSALQDKYVFCASYQKFFQHSHDDFTKISNTIKERIEIENA